MQEIPYPVTLYAACLRRIRAEQKIMISRAAILKAYLNRINDNNNQKLKVMLDKENMNQGYLCGRLFATLEYIQERANNIHTIRERYMNAASATPAAVFSTILNLSNHHIEKLEKGAQIFFEGLKGEIMQKIAANGFPAHLDLNDQGRFFVGYYHQRQEFYKKNETSENEE
jgi:CRISPR-associated protein Csd1